MVLTVEGRIFFPYQELNPPKDTSSLFLVVPYFLIKLRHIHPPRAMLEVISELPIHVILKGTLSTNHG